MRPAILGCALLLLSACDGGGPPPIRAAEGGRVTSPDGIFTLVIPPGALHEDTPISIEILAEEDWPVSSPSLFRLVGAVYAVKPAVVGLRADVYGVHLVSAVPEALVSPEGDEILAAHYSYSTDGLVAPAPASRTVYLADGRVAVIATLHELNVHWVGDRVALPDRTLVSLSARFEAEAGEHAAGETWRASVGELRTDLRLPLVGRASWSSVVHGAGTPTVEPAVETGWQSRTWDATWDPDLGLHVWEALGIGESARTETIASLRDPTPTTIDAAAPLSPVSTPLPGWTCATAGADPGSSWLGVDVVSGASSGTVSVGIAREIGDASCP